MTECSFDSDCDSLNFCNLEENECTHNEVFPTTEPIEIIAYIIIPIMLGLQNVAGLGAGTIKIFVLVLMLNYSMTESTSHTFPFLLGAKLADTILTMRRKHAIFTDRPIIDFNIVMIFYPSISMGSALGSQFNPVMPTIASSILILIIVALAFVKTFKKVKQFYQRRKQEIKQQKSEEKSEQKQITATTHNNNNDKTETPESQPQVGEPTQHQPHHAQVSNSDPKALEPKQEVQLQMKDVSEEDWKRFEEFMEEQKKIPLKKIGIIILILLCAFILTGLQGTRKGDSFIGISTCSPLFWVFFVLQFPMYIIFFLIIKKIIEKEEEICKKVNYQRREFEVSILEAGLHKFVLNGFLCGFVIGFVGFGGGLLIVPIMAGLGLHPRTATASTSFLILFSGITSLAIATLDKQIEAEALFFFLSLAFFGGLLFTIILNKIIDYFKLGSLTIGFTAFVQLALFTSTLAIFINDLATKEFSEMTETKDIC